MPTATVAAVVGASHFMISTHARVMAGMIAQHVAWAEHNARSAAETDSLAYNQRGTGSPAKHSPKDHA
jgi:hypothetical protein